MAALLDETRPINKVVAGVRCEMADSRKISNIIMVETGLRDIMMEVGNRQRGTKLLNAGWD